MSDEQEYERIENKYPLLFKTDLQGGKIYVGAGWLPLIEKLAENIYPLILKQIEADKCFCGATRVEHTDTYVCSTKGFKLFHTYAIQIKSKFHGLRFYISGGNREINAFISNAEYESIFTCETCGTALEKVKDEPGQDWDDPADCTVCK